MLIKNVVILISVVNCVCNDYFEYLFMTLPWCKGEIRETVLPGNGTDSYC